MNWIMVRCIFIIILDLTDIGSEVWEAENDEYAQLQVKHVLLSQKISDKPLILHSDNGSPMKSTTFLVTLEKLIVINKPVIRTLSALSIQNKSKLFNNICYIK